MKKFIQVIIFCVIIFTTTSCQKQIFDGSRTSDDKQFILDYSVLSKTITHEMKLEQGTVIDVSIEDTSGRVDILVTNEDDKKIYRGDNASSGNFSIEIPESKTYKFSVTGNKAKGSVSFIVEE
jgi:hypothetical protein